VKVLRSRSISFYLLLINTHSHDNSLATRSTTGGAERQPSTVLLLGRDLDELSDKNSQFFLRVMLYGLHNRIVAPVPPENSIRETRQED